MVSTKPTTRLGRRDPGDAGRRLLRELLREAVHAESVRAELDGDRSEDLELLVDELRDHIELVERGEVLPDPVQFGHWLDSVRRIPAGAPSRWRRAARLAKSVLRPLVSAKRTDTASDSRQEPKKIPGEVA